MNRIQFAFFAIASAFAVASQSLHAADPAQPSAAETRLRDSLRNTMLQLRTSENDKAVLQATQAESDEKNKALTAQVEALTKQLAADKDATDKNTASFQAKLEERDKTVGDLRESLDKWKADHKRISEIAVVKEAQRAKLDEQVILLNRRVADQQTKNAAMFKIANEILQRYERFGLGDALSAREPFTGITRVKLQSLFEEYQDKLVDQKIKPAEGKAPEPDAPGSSDKTAKPKATPAKSAGPKAAS